jgi:hypothetical protein
MEELLELKEHLEHQRYAEALALIGEMEEMSREDKINKIYSYAIILLLHLIKQQAEKRSTRSWEFSIWNSVHEIQRVNKRRKTGGYYLAVEELHETIDEAYPTALKKAALEAFDGQYETEQLAGFVDENQIKQDALEMLLQEQNK